MLARRAFLSVTISATIVAGGLAGAPALAAPGSSGPDGEAPPPAVSELRSAAPAATAATSSGVLTYRVDTGGDLDQYLYHQHSPLDFAIDVVDHFGPVDAAGAPAPGNALYGETALLTIRAYDVDEISGEIDRIVVNGVQLDGQLSGANNQWATDTFSFPTELLRLPAEDGAVARNDFQVLIDESNTGWAVQIDWAELRPAHGRDGVRPVAFLHGITADQSSWSEGESTMATMKREFVEDQPQLSGRAIAPPMTKNGSVEQNAEILSAEVGDLLQGEPYQQIDIVAHSMGGLAGRLYAFDNPGAVRRLVMLGTPNAGSTLADVLCANRNTPWWIRGGGQYLVDYLTRDFGPCEGPENGAYQLQTGYVIDVFNKQVPDRPSVEYATIPGTSGGPGSILLDGDDDGTVSVSSVRYLDRLGDHGGLHTSLGRIDTDHMGLIFNEESGSFLEAFCFLYPEHEDCADSAGGGVGGGGGGSWRMSAVAAGEVPGQNAGGAADVVPAGETRAYPLAVGDGEAATVVLLAEPGLEFSAGSAVFEPTTVFDVPAVAATFTGPTTLTMTNGSAGPQGFQAYLFVESDRALRLEAPTFVRAGDEVPIVATLSRSLPGDVVHFQVAGSAGTIAGGQMTSTGDGLWAQTVTAPAGGAFTVTVWVEGPEPRTVGAPLVVGAGGEIGDGFAEGTTDEDGNGLTDRLDIIVPVSVDDAGEYRLAGRLVDAQGARVAEAGTSAVLDAGSGTLTLSFGGRAINASARPGPWQLVDVTLSDAEMSMIDTKDLGETSAFDPADFEHDELTVGAFADTAVDGDGDGRYDVLRVSVDVTARVSGTYALNGKLVAQDGTEVARAQTTAHLGAATTTLELQFDGNTIGLSGRDGPYILRDFAIYPTAAPSGGLALVDAYETAAYRNVEFAGGVASDTAPVAEFGTQAADGLVVTFDGSLSSDDHGIVEYAWDFGDGTTAAGALVEHRFAGPGTYVVALRVTDSNGQTGEKALGVDVVHTCQGQPATIVAQRGTVVFGTPGTDVVVGTDATDIIMVGAGDDLVCARGGDDLVHGGGGVDVVYGGAGRDLLMGHSGDDRLFGDDGDDLLVGGLGDDELTGGAGWDVLSGGPGTDTLTP